MSVQKLVLALAAVAAAILAWSWWHADARRVERRLRDLAEAVEKSPGENQLTAALKAEEVASFFADPFEFRAPQFDFETRDRQALVRAVALYRGRSERVVSRILDRHLEVDSPARKATMVFDASFAGGWSGLGKNAYRFRLDWVEQGGKWRIAYAELIEILPPGRF